MIRALVLMGFFSSAVWAESGPVRETTSPAFIGKLMPAFYNGWLYSCLPCQFVTLFAPDGQILNLAAQGRGNGKVNVESVAIHSDGTLAVAWADPPNSGIDIRDHYGTLIRSIDTGRYIPAHLSFGDDGSLWALGWQTDPARPLYPAKEDYAIVRRYSMDGKEIGAYLPRSRFPPGLEPGMTERQKRRITVTTDRVGVEAVSGKVGNQREWVELDLHGNISGRWKLDSSDEFPGVAFTSDNQAYVHRYDREAKTWQVFRLNRTVGTWDQVGSPNAELYGADGDQLVYSQWPDEKMHLSWYPQPRP